MARLLLLLSALTLGLGLRYPSEWDSGWVERPSGPSVEPKGRHIQMLFWNIGHGLTDRMTKYLRPLVALGAYHNATVHILDGADGVQRYLTGLHTPELAKSWGRYFDLKANGGNPFHPPQNFRGCREIQPGFKHDELLTLFEGGVRCVNFLTMVGVYNMMPWDIKRAWAPLPLSKEILTAADAFLARYQLPQRYGSCHVRRCDYFLKNMNCTAPQALAESIQGFGGGLETWVFFLYAEQGYRQALAKALEPLKIKALFEDDVVLNDVYPKDNYFTYLLGKYLNGGAETILETHYCISAVPRIFKGKGIDSHGIFLPGQRLGRQELAEDEEGDAFMELEEEAGAVCDDRARGAKILQGPSGIPKDWRSPLVQKHER